MPVMASRKPKKTDRHKTPKLQFHIPPDLKAALDRYIDATRPEPTVTAVLRLAVERFLEGEGHWPPPPT